jgi:hypothetical protein
VAAAAEKAAAAKKAEEAAKNPVAGFFSDVFSAVSAPFGAISDFARNYKDMRTADVLKQDGYFHCKANYEAASRGLGGVVTAMQMDSLRELTDAVRGRSSFTDYKNDMSANALGLERGYSGRYSSAQEACADLRPNGLPDKY